MTQDISEIQLVFCPLVDTNFGSYFPSTAVLAGYLSHKGLSAKQFDLNEKFAEYLLDDENLQKFASGHPPGLGVDLGCHHISAVAGRWLLRNKSKIFSPDGKHDFQPQANPTYLLAALARQYFIDLDLSSMADFDRPSLNIENFYISFYERSGYLDSISSRTGVVGLSVPMGPQLVPAILLARLIKEKSPSTRVILGGPTMSLMSQHDLELLIAQNPCLDAVVRFDGELPLASLCEQVRNGLWEPLLISNVSAMSVEGEVKHIAPGPGQDMKALPAPEYDSQILNQLANPELGVLQARGCYWGKCSYCDFIELYDGSRKYRGRSGDVFIDELELLIERHGIRKFALITESIPPAFARRISTLILERGLEVKWDTFAMVDRKFDVDLLDLMVRAGCSTLFVGMESMNTRVLKLVNKSADREENIRFLLDAKKVGMNLRVNLIPDLPTTTYDEALASLNDIAEYKDCVEGFAIFPFEATRSSAIGRNPEKFGLTIVGKAVSFGKAEFPLNHLTNEDRSMTLEQRREIHRRYQEFANSVVSNRLRNGSSQFRTTWPAVGESMALKVEYLDIVAIEGSYQCTNVLTRETIRMPKWAWEALEPFIDGSPFLIKDLVEASGNDRAMEILGSLLENRMLANLESQPSQSDFYRAKQGSVLVR
jgi:hypothetical protein